MRPRRSRPRDTFFQDYLNRFARKIEHRINGIVNDFGNRAGQYLYDEVRRHTLSYLPGEDPYGDRGSGYRVGLGGVVPPARGKFRRADQPLVCPNCHVPIYGMGNGRLLCARCGGQFFVLQQENAALGGQPNIPADDLPFRGKKARQSKATYANAPYARPNPRKRKQKQKQRPSPPPPHFNEPEPTSKEAISAAYRLLGLKFGVTTEEVKQRRRELAQKYHPDHGGDAEKLKSVNAAADLVISSIQAEL